ncbi:hypothetical protein NMG60_11007073 [Bertholletia excelsa]
MTDPKDTSTGGTPRQEGTGEGSSGSISPASGPRTFFAALFGPPERSTRALGEPSGSGPGGMSEGMEGLQIGGGGVESASGSDGVAVQRKRSREEALPALALSLALAPAPASAPGQIRIRCPICLRDDFDSPQSIGGHMSIHGHRDWRGIHPPPVFSRDEFRDVQHLLNREEEEEEQELIPEKSAEGAVAPPSSSVPEHDKTREESTSRSMEDALTEGGDEVVTPADGERRVNEIPDLNKSVEPLPE